MKMLVGAGGICTFACRGRQRRAVQPAKVQQARPQASVPSGQRQYRRQGRGRKMADSVQSQGRV